MPVYEPMPRFGLIARRPLWIATVGGCFSVCAFGALAGSEPVSFVKDIAPIVVAKCVTCHQPSKTKGGYQLHTYKALMSPGRSKETPIVSGQPDKSHLYRLLLARDPDDRMPQNDEALPAEQVAVIRRWIEEGAKAGSIDPDQVLSSLVGAAGQPAPPANYTRVIPILGLAFHPSGTEIASGAFHEVIVWDARSGRLLRRIQNIARQVQQLAFSPDGRYLAIAAGTSGRLGEVKLYDTTSNQMVRTVGAISDLMTTVAFSPDGHRLAMAGADNTIKLIDVESGSQLFRAELNADWVMQLVFSPDGKQLASASRDKTARLLDASKGELEQTYTGHSGVVFAVAFSPDGKTLLSAGRDRSIHLWQESDAKKLGDSGPAPAEILKLTVIDARILAGLANGEIREYRVNSKRVEFVRKFGQHGDAIGALAAHDSSARLATAGYDGRIRTWNVEKGELEREFSGLPGQ